MDPQRAIKQFPEWIEILDRGERHPYMRCKKMMAVHKPKQTIDDAEVDGWVDGGSIAVCESNSPNGRRAATDEADISPVYRTSDNAPWQVPTGRIYIRVQTDTDQDSLMQRLSQLGFRLHSKPKLPTTLWISAEDGSIKHALSQLKKIAELPGVTTAFPEMLTPAQKK